MMGDEDMRDLPRGKTTSWFPFYTYKHTHGRAGGPTISLGLWNGSGCRKKAAGGLRPNDVAAATPAEDRVPRAVSISLTGNQFRRFLATPAIANACMEPGSVRVRSSSRSCRSSAPCGVPPIELERRVEAPRFAPLD